MRYLTVALLPLLLNPLAGAEDQRGFRFTTGESFLPPMKAVVIVQAGAPGPDAAKHRSVAAIRKYRETITVPVPTIFGGNPRREWR